MHVANLFLISKEHKKQGNTSSFHLTPHRRLIQER
jgi:hypothetical protein